MPSHPTSTITVTNIEPCGEAKVCITLEVVVDAHRMAEVGGQMLSVAAKGAASKRKKTAPGFILRS
ncbi:MAG: hypothetical protein JWP16_2717 [Alphaproteobacteria bacterium]|nr:hypothetical protein [Alphaproteobacteria bacterium]